MNVRDEAGLGLAVLSVQQALISAYEDNCHPKPAKKGKHSLKWTQKLKCLGTEVRQVFNKYRADKTPQSWQIYIEAQRRYRKEGLERCMEAFCNSVNDLPMLARLHRALSWEPKIKL